MNLRANKGEHQAGSVKLFPGFVPPGIRWKLCGNVNIAASEVSLLMNLLRLVSAPASPATPGSRRGQGAQEGGRGQGLQERGTRESRPYSGGGEGGKNEAWEAGGKK